MGLFDGYGGPSPWGGGGVMGQQLGGNNNTMGGWQFQNSPAYMPASYQPSADGGYWNQQPAYMPPRNPFSSFAPAPQGPAGGPAPMQPQQPQQAQSDPLMQTGFQPAPLNAGGVPGYGGGMGAMDKFMGQIPQQGPMVEASAGGKPCCGS
jgi:hypothetical protein